MSAHNKIVLHLFCCWKCFHFVFNSWNFEFSSWKFIFIGFSKIKKIKCGSVQCECGKEINYDCGGVASIAFRWFRLTVVKRSVNNEHINTNTHTQRFIFKNVLSISTDIVEIKRICLFLSFPQSLDSIVCLVLFCFYGQNGIRLHIASKCVYICYFICVVSNSCYYSGLWLILICAVEHSVYFFFFRSFHFYENK